MQASILFVEDNQDLRENAATILNLEGYDVQVARDGREALDILEAGFFPHLIVSDIMMPRMDGYEFFHAVRQYNHLKTVPFIFLTALGSRRDVSVGKMLGADDYLVKPFEPEEFLIAIQNKLQRTAEIRAGAAEELDTARRRLIQLLSHELRTPLTYVTGGFALLAEEIERLRQYDITEDVRISLDLIQSGTQRLNRLAEQMVLYTQIISGFIPNRIKNTGETLELSALLFDATSDVFSLSQKHDIRLSRLDPVDTDALHTFGVRELLITAVSELLRNAIIYSSPGSTVEIALSHDEDWGCVTISDTGPGISLSDQETIWDVLIQSNRERDEQQGAGMGLPLAKGIIEAHDGTIALHSVSGEGTDVTLCLPLVETENEDESL